jgi:hypothetical protein
MQVLDLFNTRYERELQEGAVDDLESRRIDLLNDRMQDLLARARESNYKNNPAALASLKKQFQQVKDERDSYYKVREGRVTPTATGLRHHARPENYGGYEPERELKGLNKTLTKNLEKGMGIEFKKGGVGNRIQPDVDEAGIPGNVPVEKIPGKEDLLKGKGRSYYEDQKKNSEVAEVNWNDEDDYEDEDLRLRSGDYVRDTMDGEHGEIFRMQGDPEERRVRILDRDGKGWYIEPSRLTRVDPTDPDVQRYFGKQRVRDMDESGVEEDIAGIANYLSNNLELVAFLGVLYGWLSGTYKKDWQKGKRDLENQGTINKPIYKVYVNGKDIGKGLKTRKETFALIKNLASKEHNPDTSYTIFNIETDKIEFRQKIGQQGKEEFSEQGVAEAISKKDLLGRLEKDLPKVTDPKNKHAKSVEWTGAGKDDYGYTGYQGHGMPTDKQERELARKKKGVAESSKPGEYYIHTVYFKDGTKKRIRVTSDEFDVADYYTKRGQAVDRVDYDFQLHSNMTEQSSLPGTKIPQKSVMQGYTVFYNPKTRLVSITRGGDSEEAAIEQARISQPTMLAFRSAVDRIINKIENDQGITEAEKEPTTRQELLNRVDKIQRMMTLDRNPANLQILRKELEMLKQRYQHLREDNDSEAVEIAIIRRILVAHTDLIMEFGLDKVTQAIEEVAYNVGDVDEIGTSDVSAYVQQVKQILGVDA